MGKNKYKDIFERKDGFGHCRLVSTCNEKWPMNAGDSTNTFVRHCEKENKIEWNEFQKQQNSVRAVSFDLFL